MQSLCNQSVTRKMSWSVGGMAGVMINAPEAVVHHVVQNHFLAGASHETDI
jgi:hypothetical protein